MIGGVPTTCTLAQAGRVFSEVLPWLTALLVFVVIGAIVLSAVRRRMVKGDRELPGAGFTLHGLRELHANGNLSDEEFERAKAALIERVRGSASEKGPNEEGSGPNPT